MRLFSVLFTKSKIPVKLHLDLISQPCRTLDVFTRVNSLNVEYIIVRLFEGQQFSDEFQKLNPLMKVPVMEDNGFTLSESVAIAKYLCREKSVPDHWYPKDSTKQARVDEFIDWHHLGLRAPATLLVVEKCFKPVLMGKHPNDEIIKIRLKDTIAAIDRVNDVWLGDKRFLTGDEISLADLFAVNELEQLKLTGYDPRTGRPKLANWIERVRDKCNPHYDKSFEFLNKLAARVKQQSEIL